MENNLRYLEARRAALRSGLLIAPVNRYLTADEAAYIINDSQARAVVSSLAMRELAEGLGSRMPDCPLRLMVDGTIAGWQAYEPAIAAHPAERLADEWMGATMFYSSGTTGRPKGIIRAQQGGRVSEGLNAPRLRQLAALRAVHRHRVPVAGAALPRRAAGLLPVACSSWAARWS
jgi:fatty-acyl-CoA synthase